MLLDNHKDVCLISQMYKNIQVFEKYRGFTARNQDFWNSKEPLSTCHLIHDSCEVSYSLIETNDGFIRKVVLHMRGRTKHLTGFI